MVVDGDRVGVLDAVQQRAPGGRDEQTAAVGGVDVHPGVVLRAQLGDLGQRVDRAEVGGAGGADDRHRDQALGLAAAQLGGEHLDPHAALAVGGDGHHRVRAEAEQRRRLADAEVADVGGEDAQLGGVRRLGLLAGEQHRLEVGLRAAAGEDAVGALAEADPARRPVDEAPLDEGAARRLVPGVQGGVDRREDRFAEHRRDDDRAVEVGQVARVVEVDGVTEVHVGQLVQRRGGVAERAVEVDGVDHGGERGRGDAGERAGGTCQRCGHALDTFGDGAAVRLHVQVVQQVRPGREETHERSSR